MIKKIKNAEKISHLFHCWDEPMIRACLQGVMGSIYAPTSNPPSAAMAILGDFCFLAGTPNKELICYKPKEIQKDFIIMIPQNKRWGTLIEQHYREKAKKVLRYATKKEAIAFDIKKLQQAVANLPAEYQLRQIDEPLYYKCQTIDWCNDWVAQYKNYQTFQEKGLGFVILKNGQPVSGASSYASYNGGIEIEIDTLESYRRKGLAYICGAKLILECLNKKLYPHWDAQNKYSLALAMKLGYHFSHSYLAYEICGY